MGSKLHKDGYISFGPGAKLVFHGKACFACGDTIMLGKDAELVIGKDFSTNVLCEFFVSSRVAFGDDCFCGWRVSVRDGDGHYIVDLKTGEKLNYPKGITIGSHVWLASDATILKGVTVADDCVVACNSLVTKSLTESHAIYGGNPARRIKSGVSFIKDGHGYGENQKEEE